MTKTIPVEHAMNVGCIYVNNTKNRWVVEVHPSLSIVLNDVICEGHPNKLSRYVVNPNDKFLVCYTPKTKNFHKFFSVFEEYVIPDDADLNNVYIHKLHGLVYEWLNPTEKAQGLVAMKNFTTGEVQYRKIRSLSNFNKVTDLLTK